jgi:hypothetical protein
LSIGAYNQYRHFPSWLDEFLKRFYPCIPMIGPGLTTAVTFFLHLVTQDQRSKIDAIHE